MIRSCLRTRLLLRLLAQAGSETSVASSLGVTTTTRPHIFLQIAPPAPPGGGGVSAGVVALLGVRLGG